MMTSHFLATYQVSQEYITESNKNFLKEFERQAKNGHLSRNEFQDAMNEYVKENNILDDHVIEMLDSFGFKLVDNKVEDSDLYAEKMGMLNVIVVELLAKESNPLMKKVLKEAFLRIQDSIYACEICAFACVTHFINFIEGSFKKFDE